jgi:hypothetical protein
VIACTQYKQYHTMLTSLKKSWECDSTTVVTASAWCAHASAPHLLLHVYTTATACTQAVHYAQQLPLDSSTTLAKTKHKLNKCIFGFSSRKVTRLFTELHPKVVTQPQLTELLPRWSKLCCAAVAAEAAAASMVAASAQAPAAVAAQAKAEAQRRTALTRG